MFFKLRPIVPFLVLSSPGQELLQLNMLQLTLTSFSRFRMRAGVHEHCPATHLLKWDHWTPQNHGATGSIAVNERDNNSEWFLHGGKCIFDPQSDILMAVHSRSVPMLEFYSSLKQENFAPMRHAQKILVLFGCIFICEQTFSVMKFNKFRYRSSSTYDYLHSHIRHSARFLCMSSSPKQTKMKLMSCLSITYCKTPFQYLSRLSS